LLFDSSLTFCNVQFRAFKPLTSVPLTLNSYLYQLFWHLGLVAYINFTRTRVTDTKARNNHNHGETKQHLKLKKL